MLLQQIHDQHKRMFRVFKVSRALTVAQIQMNYWGAELWNLPETLESLTKMMEEVAVSGRETAQNLWGANSSAASSGSPPWVVHHKCVA